MESSKPFLGAARSNGSRMRELYEAWNQRDWAAVRARLAPDVEWFHAGRHELVRGSEAVVELLKSHAEVFPDARVDVRALHDIGETVLVEWTLVHPRASQAEEPKPAIVCDVVRFQHGRCARGTTYGDTFTILMEFREAYRPPLRAVC
jgi:ketosteroid isomerase-like protein